MTVGLLLVSLLTFVELNCENLFDCRHDSLRADTEFLPEAPRHWTASRYWRKLDNIGRPYSRAVKIAPTATYPTSLLYARWKTTLYCAT